MQTDFILDLKPFRFSISTDSERVIANLHTIYGKQFQANQGQVTDYHLRLERAKGLRRFWHPQARFFCDQQEPFKPLKHDQAYAFLEWGMNYTVAANEMQYVIVHSGVLAKDNKAILFPAPPGSGKSTLTSYLAHSGWRLLSDEMALIHPNSKWVQPFVRPICLKNNSIPLAKRWFPHANFSTIAKDTHKGDVIHLSPPAESWQQADQAAEIVAVVFPNYRADIELDIYQLNQNQGFMQLAENAFNYGVMGESGFSTLTQIIESSGCYEIFYNDLKEVKKFLEELI